MPSGNAMATTVLLRLAALTGEGRYRDAAERALRLRRRRRGPLSERLRPVARALDFALGRCRRGRRSSASPRRTRRPGGSSPRRPDRLPPAPRRRAARPTRTSSASRCSRTASRLDGRPTAFVCRQFACRQPVNEPEALAAQLVVG